MVPSAANAATCLPSTFNSGAAKLRHGKATQISRSFRVYGCWHWLGDRRHQPAGRMVCRVTEADLQSAQLGFRADLDGPLCDDRSRGLADKGLRPRDSRAFDEGRARSLGCEQQSFPSGLCQGSRGRKDGGGNACQPRRRAQTSRQHKSGRLMKNLKRRPISALAYEKTQRTQEPERCR
jgi:hypothetical protein